MFKVLAATNNAHKVEEFKNLLGFVELDIVQPKDIPNFPEIIEDGSTFEENSEIKALKSSNFACLPAFADDSGLVVDALGGRPGIYSARYAGEDATDTQRMEKLLEELKDESNRTARFVCVIAIAMNGKIIKTFRGEVEGVIAREPQGENGFGYDPIFIPTGYDTSFAELGSDIKDIISHRAQAMKGAKEFILGEITALDSFF